MSLILLLDYACLGCQYDVIKNYCRHEQQEHCYTVSAVVWLKVRLSGSLLSSHKHVVQGKQGQIMTIPVKVAKVPYLAFFCRCLFSLLKMHL